MYTNPATSPQHENAKTGGILLRARTQEEHLPWELKDIEVGAPAHFPRLITYIRTIEHNCGILDCLVPRGKAAQLW